MSQRRIRIMHIAQAAGGVDRFLRTLLKYLDPLKFDNIAVVSRDYEKKDYEGLVSSFEYVDMSREIGPNDVRSVFVVRRLIKKYKPDVVFAHSSKAGAIARLANVGFKSVCIYNPHGWAFNMRGSRLKRRLYVEIEKLEALFCQKIICISKAEKKSAVRNGICNQNKLKVIYNGIDIESSRIQMNELIEKQELGIPNDSFVIGMVGRLSEQKSPDIFIKAAKKIKDLIPNAFFLMVGSGEQEEAVVEFARRNGFVDSLLITGWVENPVKYMRVFDVACLLSRWEGFGLVLPEYMMVGKPIIATNVDAIPYIVKNEINGLLVKPDDVNGVCSAALRIYKELYLRRKLVDGGYKTLPRYDAKRMGKEYGELFLELTHNLNVNGG